jgi:hypothetical protein
MKVYKNGGGLEPDPIIRKLLEKFDGDLDKAMEAYIASSDNPEKAKRQFERFARRMENKLFRQENKGNIDAGPVSPQHGRRPGDGTAESLHDIRRNRIRVEGAGTVGPGGVLHPAEDSDEEMRAARRRARRVRGFRVQ